MIDSKRLFTAWRKGKMLGIISGTILLQERNLLNNAEEIIKVNEFGRTTLHLSDTISIIARHGYDPRNYTLPHSINHRANLKALQDVGATEIIGINSTGSLKKRIQPGTIVIPDDFIMMLPYHSIYDDKAVHITPGFDKAVRQRCLDAARTSGTDVMDGGVYWQTTGPRLETKAEISMMSQFADIVGMTMANEAIIAKELGLPYATICSVDNYANGIGEQELTIDEISSHARSIGNTIFRILSSYIEYSK
jgi:5'-methylthioadenosine phosphorylase